MTNYVGKVVQLFPEAKVKFGIITSVDELGWTIKITQSTDPNYKVGSTYFFSRTVPLSFMFVADGSNYR